jgi:hypothetical protein
VSSSACEWKSPHEARFLAYRFLAYRFLAYRFAGSRLALAAMADTLSENNTPWTSHFFDEEHIVDTFQNLLAYTPQTVEDLYRLCVAAREDRIVLAFTVQGLVPFANHPEFVFCYSGMSCLQLQAIRRESQLLRDTLVCDYDVDIYLLKMSLDDFEVDHALLLFAAGCLLLKGLSTIKQHRGGYSVTRLTNNKELLMFHANAMLFNVVNSCNLKAGAQRAAGQLLHKHRVYGEES